MIKTILITLSLIVNVKAISQDTLTPQVTLQKLKPGVYLKFNEFINNNPSITTPLKAIPNYRIKTTDSIEPTDIITTDSVMNGYCYQLSDLTIKHKKAFGFFDGKQFYIDTKQGIDLRKHQIFFPVDYIGRYMFIEMNSKKPITLLTLGLVSLLDQAIGK